MEGDIKPVMPLVPKVALVGVMLAGFGGTATGLLDVYAETFQGDLLDGSLHLESKFQSLLPGRELSVGKVAAYLWVAAGIASLSLDKKYKGTSKSVLLLSGSVFAVDEYLLLSAAQGGISDVDQAFWGGVALMSGSQGIVQTNKVLKGRA